MQYETKEMRPGKGKTKFVIEVTSRSSGNSWSLTTTSEDKAQDILDSIDYKSKPVMINKSGKFIIKLEVK